MKDAEVPVAPFFALGVFMPIDFIQTVPPVILDGARYGTALLIMFLVHSARRTSRPVPILGVVAFLLIFSGGLSVLKSVVFDGNLFAPIVSLVSPLVAYLVVRTQVNHRWILLGFTFGCFLSALDILLQASGLPFLGTPSEYGFRHSGFSYSSTAVAPLLAVAICVALMPWVWEKRRTVLRIILVCVLLIALFLSQGRGGLAGLMAALAILAFIYLPRKPGLTIIATLVGGLAIVISGAAAALVDYISRTDIPGSSDITSGRANLNFAAWEAFWRAGVLGVDPAESHHYNPHMAPLSAALNIGPFGLIATSVVCILLLVVIFFAGRDFPIVLRMIAGIAFTVSLIEPNGFFVGFTGAVLVMICFANYRRNKSGSQQNEQWVGADMSV